MKLKKIASLMLAGIMAVSMLAGCKSASDNGNGGASSSEPTTSSAFTDSVLNKTKESTRLVFAADSNDKLDKAVALAAKNHVQDQSTSRQEKLTVVTKNWEYQTLADSVMKASDVDYAGNGSSDHLANLLNDNVADKNDKTVYTMYTVSRAMDDEWIAGEVAKLLDEWATILDEDTATGTYDYSVRVAIADSLTGKEADRSKDTVVIGIAVTCDFTSVNY